MTDDSTHMHQLFYALQRAKSRSPFQIAKLCICVQACYEGPVFCHGFSVYMLAEDAAMASISKDGYDKDQSS